ncbi:MAG: SpoIIE family protein phosphatase, partial [Leptospiraceae bacterium]|nr:SpoIIE family protein phosphatase [Leptospiraceae bacterium]
EVALGEKGEIIQKYIRLEMGEGVVGWVAKEEKSVLIKNAYEDDRFDSSWDKRTGFHTKSIICVPLFQKHNLIGTLEVMNKTGDRLFDESDLDLLNALADLAAIAIENSALQENLKKRIMELSLLYNFDKEISSNVDIHHLGNWLLDHCLENLGARAGSILLWQKEGYLNVLKSKGIPLNILENLKIFPGEGIAGWVAKEKESLLIKNIDTDPRFQNSKRANYETNSLISVPLIAKGELIGVLNINNKKDGFSFTRNDLHLARALGERLAIAINNATYLNKVNISEEENNRAKKLIKKIIPAEVPNLEGVQIQADYIPFREIGGDFYNFFKIDENNLGVLIGDVSGHGLSSALLTVMANTVIQSFEKSYFLGPAEFLIYLNKCLTDKMGGYFLTACYCVINFQNNTMKYAKAGHPGPIIYQKKQDKILNLKSAGKILGIFPNVIYEERIIPFEKGDFLVLFTDGIIETTNLDTGKTYDLDILLEFINQNRDNNLEDLNKQILQNSLSYVNIKEFGDDVSIISIIRS